MLPLKNHYLTSPVLTVYDFINSSVFGLLEYTLTLRYVNVEYKIYTNGVEMYNVYVVFAILLAFFSFNLYTNYFHYKWLFLSVMAGLGVSTYLYQDFGIFVPLFFMYCLVSALYVGLYGKNNHFCHITPKGKKQLNPPLSMAATKAALGLLSLFVIYMVVNKGNISHVWLSIKWLLVVNVFLTLLPDFITKKLFTFTSEKGGPVMIRGFGANISTNATLLSLMAPFAMIDFYSDIYVNGTILALCLLAIIKTTAATGLGAYVASLVVFFSLSLHLDVLTMVAIAVLAAIAILIADAFHIRHQVKILGSKKPKRLWDLSGRLEIWKFSREIIKGKTMRWLGIGVGAYQYVMPTMQSKHLHDSVKSVVKLRAHNAAKAGKPMTKEQAVSFANKTAAKMPGHLRYRYVWMHSDIMQFMIEGGYIGFALLVLAFASIVYTAIITQNYAALAFIASYVANSATNFPSHLAPDSFLTVVMLKYIILIGI